MQSQRKKYFLFGGLMKTAKIPNFRLKNVFMDFSGTQI